MPPNGLPLSEKFNGGKEEITRRLTDLRNKLAEKSGEVRYKILQNKTIDYIAQAAPQTLEELSAIKGIGPKKLKELGSAILAITKGEAFAVKEKEIRLADSDEIIFSVSEFLDKINDILCSQNVLVQGEISSVNVHPSGVYLTLKDKKGEGILDCYIRPHVYEDLGIELADGMEVKIGGFPSVYKRSGRFRFVVQTLELTGEGSLKKSYELLKKKLEAEGLFARKRPIPEFIKRIGIITSKQGAVIEDFKNNLERLGFELFMKDVRVEGIRAVEDITEALRWFNDEGYELDLDVLVVMRGGGSMEDLQAFDNELVARAVFASKIPTICGIGHHKDITIASLVGDEAPSTPTGAAMKINQSWGNLVKSLPMLEKEMFYAYSIKLTAAYNRVNSLSEKMINYFKRAFTKFESLKSALLTVYEREFVRVVERVGIIEKYLASVNPERNLKLGYSIVTDNSGKVIKDSSQVKRGEDIKTKLYKGEVISKVKEIK